MIPGGYKVLWRGARMYQFLALQMAKAKEKISIVAGQAFVKESRNC